MMKMIYRVLILETDGTLLHRDFATEEEARAAARRYKHRNNWISIRVVCENIETTIETLFDDEE